jgi:DHA1 family bicyclomycin/chloramphenicol resistance-like MFS transporter
MSSNRHPASGKTNSKTNSKKKADIGLFEFVALMATMTSLVALSIDSVLPALSQIGAYLEVTDSRQTHLIVSVFFVGMALGQLFYGPLSDDKGRRYVIISGLIVFAVGSLVCINAESLEVMLIGRVIQAFGVSGPRVYISAYVGTYFWSNHIILVFMAAYFFIIFDLWVIDWLMVFYSPTRNIT